MNRLPEKPARASRLLAVLALLLPLVTAGCGKGRGDLHGTVSLEGKKLVMGTVWIIASDSMPYYAPISEDGRYAFKNVPAGEAKVAVYSPDPRGSKGRRDGDRGEDPRLRLEEKEAGPKVDPKKWFPIPERYAFHYSSPLTVTINPGDTQFDIRLTK